MGGALSLQTSGLQNFSIKPYNRDADGVDILAIAHDNLIDALAEQGVVAVKVLS